MLKRGGWIAALAALLVAGGAVLLFLRVVFLEDRQGVFPPTETAPSGPRQTSLSLTTVPLLGTAPAGDLTRSTVLPEILSSSPDVQFQWNGALPGVAHVTLSDGMGRTRLPVLVAVDGSVFEWNGPLPSSASFQFRTGVLGPTANFHFTVELLEGPAPPHLLYSESRLAPHSLSSGRWSLKKLFKRGIPASAQHGSQWQAAQVDLSAWAGRSIRLRMRVQDKGERTDRSSGIAFWGAPQILFPAVEKLHLKRRGPPSALGTNVVLSVLETTPGAGGRDVPPSLEVFLRESISFPRFYTSDIRSDEAMRHLLIAPTAVFSTATVPSPLTAWARTLSGNGYRTLAVGAFSDDMMGTLTEAGFDEIRQLPLDGMDSLNAAEKALQWVRDRPRAPVFILVYFPDLPRLCWAPPRFWASSLHGIPWSRSRLVFWRRASTAAYIGDALGQMIERLDEEPGGPLTAVVSLKGTVVDPIPIQWPHTGRRGKIFLNELGWGLRESEIRTLFAVRQGDRWPPALCRSLGQLPDVGPTLLRAIDLPVAPGGGHAWALETASLSEETNGRWVVRSPWGKALLVDGQYKYIRHGSSVQRSAGVGALERIDFPAEEIFDLWVDPGERRNLTRFRRHLLGRMREVLSEIDPDLVDVRLGFNNPAGTGVDGVVTCSAGSILRVGGTLAVASRGSYEFSFSTTALAGTVTFQTWPPDSSYSLRFRMNGRSLPSDQFFVSRWGLPLFETLKNEWIDKTEFAWMDGWAPPPPSSAPTASLGRVLLSREGDATR